MIGEERLKEKSQAMTQCSAVAFLLPMCRSLALGIEFEQRDASVLMKMNGQQARSVVVAWQVPSAILSGIFRRIATLTKRMKAGE